ncbi:MULTISPECIES: hypothetical protein [Halorussus]|uniref:hypothetical protein n=1 Tax=Halorussus TaxID=1070314 RepID=UPI000E216286|nr:MULTISPECIES: hypothetical protein [Halorussus]NHN59501.1 hypothetical protein [Halorussus sp. JP-T4]
MTRGPDRSPRADGGDTADRADAVEEAEAADERVATRPQPELRWMQLREPRHAAEVGPNGRVLDSRYHAGYDAWEVLLETYEGELTE